MTHIVLIDGSNMLRRAWSVAPKEQDAAGVELGAAALFSQMLVKLLRRIDKGKAKPPHCAIFFDPPREGTWRREMFPAYKADRDPYEPEYLEQIEVAHELCDRIGLRNARFASHEADDLIAAMTHKASAEGMRVSIVSTDKDLLQLVAPRVLVLQPMQDRWYDEKAVKERFGVGPDQLLDLMALTGDPADGIPGGKGIGPAIAAAILAQAGSLDAALEDPSVVTRKSARECLEKNAEMIRLSRTLVGLDVAGCPQFFGPRETRTPDPERAKAQIEEYFVARLPVEPETETEPTF